MAITGFEWRRARIMVVLSYGICCRPSAYLQSTTADRLLLFCDLMRLGATATFFRALSMPQAHVAGARPVSHGRWSGNFFAGRKEA